jgi:rhodanese-related sulfurtransferase
VSGPDLPRHIPGSIYFAIFREALQSLRKEDEIVVYCSDENCIASQALGQLLERNGYAHVLHLAGVYRVGAGELSPGEWVREQERQGSKQHGITSF